MTDTASSRILVVDDDVDLTVMLGQYLRAEGLRVEIVHDGENALDRIAISDRFDAVILDVMLPTISGVEVLRRIREKSDVPVIMLTAKGDRVARARGIELGADDYIAKPYFPRELIARIRAVVRRRNSRLQQGSRLQGGGIRIDKTTREAALGARKLELTATQFEILAMLLESDGAIVTKEDLSAHVLGRAWQPYDRSLDVHISNLRQKIASDTGIAITTVRSVGYKFVS
jgi:two-component system OmpR family response regulator